MPRVLQETHSHPDYPSLHLDLRSDSRYFQARAYIGGSVRLKSTKTTSLVTAYRHAEDWYRTALRAETRKPLDRLTDDPLMVECYVAYVEHRPEKQRKDDEKRWGPIQHFWRARRVSEVDAQTFEDFFLWRRKRRKGIKPHTLHKDIVLVRQVLKYAVQKGHIKAVPPIPKIGKIEPNPRPWLSKGEWELLRETSDKRIFYAHRNRKVVWQRVGAWEFAAFMVASMCRVEELQTLRFHHCQIEQIDKRKILRCEFRGKTGMRVAYAAPEAVAIYRARLKRAGNDISALVFPHHHRDAFRELLIDANLYEDHFGNRRNYKAMRATAIALAILRPNPPTLFQIARNAGTSVAVIDAFYSKRLTAEAGKDVLTAAESLPSMWRRKKPP